MSKRAKYLAYEHRIPAFALLAAEYQEAIAASELQRSEAFSFLEPARLQFWKDIGRRAMLDNEAPLSVSKPRKAMAARFHRLYEEHFLVAHRALQESNDQSPPNVAQHKTSMCESQITMESCVSSIQPSRIKFLELAYTTSASTAVLLPSLASACSEAAHAANTSGVLLNTTTRSSPNETLDTLLRTDDGTALPSPVTDQVDSSLLFPSSAKGTFL